MNVGELMVIFGLKPQGWDKGNKLLQGLAGAARRYIGVQAVESVIGLVRHATEGATHLVSMSHAMGMTIEQTQLWGYVAQQSGSNMKELAVGMNMYLRNVREVQRGGGGKSLRALFTQLGIDSEQQKKIFSGSTGLNESLLLMSDRIKAIGAKSKPLEATFTKVFGVRAGRAMLADLARGSDGIKEVMKRREQMGLLSEEQALALRDLGNRMKDVKTSFSALADLAVARLAPTFLAMAEGAVKWISANKDIISGALVGALKVVQGLFSAIGEVVSFVGDAIRRAFAGDEGAQAILVGLAAVVSAIVIPALYAMVAPIVMGALALAPWILLLTGIGVLSLLVVKHWNAIKKAVGDAAAFAWAKWQAFGAWFTGLGDRFFNAISEFGEWIKSELGKALDWVEAKLVALIKKIPGGKWALEHYAGTTGERETSGINAAEAQSGRGFGAMSAAYGAAYNAPTNAGVPSVTNVTNNVNAPIKIDGSKNPQATGEAVGEHIDNQLRQTQRGTGGETR